MLFIAHSTHVGHRIGGGTKTNVEQAVQQLKDAHKSGDIAAIDNAINNLNTVMQAASQKMYQQGGQAGPQPGSDQQYQGGQQAQSNPNDNIQDADFEEVK